MGGYGLEACGTVEDSPLLFRWHILLGFGLRPFGVGGGPGRTRSLDSFREIQRFASMLPLQMSKQA